VVPWNKKSYAIEILLKSCVAVQVNQALEVVGG